MVPKENKNIACSKFGGTNKEYYGIFCFGQLFAAKYGEDGNGLNLKKLVNSFKFGESPKIKYELLFVSQIIFHVFSVGCTHEVQY